MLRMPVDNLDKEEQGNSISKAEKNKTPPDQQAEDTISLDTKDKKYISYAKAVKNRLMQNWEYPKEAWENLIEGEVMVVFSLNRQGDLKDINILSPSNHKILDTETTRTIRSSAPFPPFPGSVTVKKLNIKASFSYRLAAKK